MSPTGDIRCKERTVTTVTGQTAADRLTDRWAVLAMSPAGQVELYEVLDMARDKVRGARRGEDPKETLMVGVEVGLAIADSITARVSPGRRGEVRREAEDWLPDVVALSESDYRSTLKAWAKRAAVAKESATEWRKAKVRA